MASMLIGRLHGDALEEWREIAARLEALRLNPNVRNHMAALGRIIADFDVDQTTDWDVHPATGAIEIRV